MTFRLLISISTCSLILMPPVVESLTLANGGDKVARRPKPAEEIRLSTSAFRGGLKDRGLTELLDLHLKDFPPSDLVSSLLMRRELKLSEFAESSLTEAERRAAMAEANRLLEEAIKESPEDKRRFDWLFEVAHSLIYQEAEPFFTSILYRGGNAQDRARLTELASRAFRTIEQLITKLDEEFERIDAMPVRQFELLERSGYVQKLDALFPRAEYLRAWILYYDTLPRPADDPIRTRRLQQLFAYLDGNASLFQVPHEESRVQVQVYLLAGMARRQAEQHAVARDRLARTLTIANRLDERFREDVKWTEALTQIEAVRNEADADQFSAAMNRLKLFRKYVEGHDEPFPLDLVASLLERSLYIRRAVRDEAYNITQTKQSRRKAWEVMFDLAHRYPDRRDEIYASVFALIEQPGTSRELDPFEAAAVVAGRLAKAEEEPVLKKVWLQQAIEAGRTFLAKVPEGSEPVIPEVLFNIGVAQYRKGDGREAAETFLAIARDHSNFERAAKAAVFAVDLTYSAYTSSNETDNGALYADALSVLLDRFPETDDAKYWRFYYAQLLESREACFEAAAQYARVDAAHEHRLVSSLFQLRCLVRGIERLIREGDHFTEVVAKSIIFNQGQDEFLRKLADDLRSAEPGSDRARVLRGLEARTKILASELQILPQINRPARSLEFLGRFEEDYTGLTHLLGRVWRVRLLAYERLGRIDEAASAIPEFIAADPVDAGPVLQDLYLEISSNLPELETEVPPSGKAKLALILAEQVFDWARSANATMSPGRIHALKVQLAEAHLAAAKVEQSLQLFKECGAQAERGDIIDVPVQMGYAEALYRLQRFGDALVVFNRLATHLPDTDDRRLTALLRDLQCRTRLNKPPTGIIQVIEQQRYLHPVLEDPPYVEKFDRLLRENQRRRDNARD